MSHEAHHSHGGNRLIALVISVLAAVLAVAEMGGKSAQTSALNLNIHASDTWNFYQAKTIRMTMYRSEADSLEVQNPTRSDALNKHIETLRKEAARLDSEPEKGEGRKELMGKAQHYEAERDHELHTYHLFEYASAALQLAIVLVSASALVDVRALRLTGMALGAGGVALTAITFFAPNLIHL